MSRHIIIGLSPSRAGSPSGGYGLYVAKPTYDADAASDDNMIFSSDWPQILPIIAGGSGTVSVPVNTLVTVNFRPQSIIPFADYAFFVTDSAYTDPTAAPISGRWYAYNTGCYYISAGTTQVQIQTYLNHFTVQQNVGTLTIAFAIYAAATVPN